MCAEGKRGANGLHCAPEQGVRRVYVQSEGIHHVGCHATAREPADVRQAICQAREVVEVAERRRTVASRLEVKCLHCRATGPEMDPIATNLEVVAGAAAIEDEGPTGAGHDVLDHRSGEGETAGGGHLGALGGGRLDQAWRGGAHAELGEEPESGIVDGADLRFAQRAKLTAALTRRRRVDLRYRCCPRGDPGSAATTQVPRFFHQRLPFRWNETRTSLRPERRTSDQARFPFFRMHRSAFQKDRVCA